MMPMKPGIGMSTRKAVVVRLCLTLLILQSATSIAFAAPCDVARTSDGELANAEQVTGAFCRMGQTKGEARDLFRFTVSPAEAGKFWSFSLRVLPDQAGRLEIFELVPGMSTKDIASAPLRLVGSTTSRSVTVETPPLLLRAGGYLLAVSGSKGDALYRISAAAGETIPGAAVPAPGQASGNFTTGLTASDKETSISWQSNDPSKRWSLTLQVSPGASVPFMLRDAAGKEIANTSFADPQGIERLADLGLAAGTYQLVVGYSPGTPVVLAAKTEEGTRSAQFAEEPDDVIARAHPLHLPASIQARLVPATRNEDLDLYRLEVDQTLAKRLIDITLSASSGTTLGLELLDAKELVLTAISAVNGGRLSGIVLDPGSYFVRVHGALPLDEVYTLELTDAEAHQPGTETEPNNAKEHATPVVSEQDMTGTLSKDERDYLAVNVESGLELWNIEVLGDGANKLALIDSGDNVLAAATRQTGTGTLKLSRVLLPHGKRVFYIDGDHGSWLFRARKIGPPSPGDEVEPNDDIGHAQPIAAGVDLHGWLDHGGDVDIYSFYLAAETRVRMNISGPAGFPVQAKLQWGEGGDRMAEFSTQPGADALEHAVWEGILPAGDYYLNLNLGYNAGWTTDPYTLRVVPISWFKRPTDHTTIKPGAPAAIATAPVEKTIGTAALPLTAALEMKSGKIAAFIEQAQEIEATLALHSTSGTPQALSLSTWVGDETWRLSGIPARIELKAGADLRIPFMLHVAPDARDDWPVGIEVELRDAAGSLVTTAARVSAEIAAPAIAAHPASQVPQALRGGLDVAWSALGGETDSAYAGLIDALVDASSVSLPVGKPVRVELAGTGMHRITGVMLISPPASRPFERLKQFEISTSVDGANFIVALKGKLTPLSREQAFVFATPVDARFVQITASSTYGSPDAGSALLAEFKVVANPAEAFSGATGFDLANAELGGHIVRTSPQPDIAVTGVDTYWPKMKASFLADRKGSPELVLGFKAGRLALATELSWLDRSDTSAQEYMQAVDISVSEIGALGPWKSLGRWQLKPQADGAAHFKFPAPVAMRALLLRVVSPESGQLALPQHIGVMEVPTGPSYQSILGEWGEDMSESGVSSEAAKATDAATVKPGHSRADAVPLTAGATASGSVRIGMADDWYKVELPPLTQQVSFLLRGNPSPEAAISVDSADGKPLSLTEEAGAPGTFSGTAQPGSYFVRISQPPRSVIVTWDTSNSVSGFSQGIKRVVEGLSRDLEIGREEINLIPFRGERSEPLMAQWGTNPGDVYSVFAGYSWIDNSSNAEAALVAASKALASRQGLHAIAIITDAASDGANLTPPLWDLLGAVHPHVFALKIPTKDTPVQVRAQTALMQDWAQSSAGYYGTFASQGAGDVQFRRMAARLRQPAAYGLSWTVSTAPPPPGFLAVKYVVKTAVGDSGAADRPAIEILIDASGSMLQKISGETKINIEKKLLTDLTLKDLPAQTPLAIRVFGQGGKGSCKSDLMLPLQPLDPTHIGGIISRIHATNGAKTAIASSLQAMPQDLADGKGKRLIVLITDGEETCNGDPAQEIRKLRQAGYDITLNIVGFSVDTAAARQSFKDWATLGGGRFFDAEDRASLKEALHHAFLSEVDILASDGKVVGHTVIGGEPIKLPAGSYSVLLADSSHQKLGAVQILPGKTATLEVSPLTAP